MNRQEQKKVLGSVLEFCFFIKKKNKTNQNIFICGWGVIPTSKNPGHWLKIKIIQRSGSGNLY